MIVLFRQRGKMTLTLDVTERVERRINQVLDDVSDTVSFKQENGLLNITYRKPKAGLFNRTSHFFSKQGSGYNQAFRGSFTRGRAIFSATQRVGPGVKAVTFLTLVL